MNLNRCTIVLLVAVIGLAYGATAYAQAPGVLYTWGGTGDILQWKKNFGTNDALLDNSIAGELTLFEIGGTAGEDIAFSDDSNRRPVASNSKWLPSLGSSTAITPLASDTPVAHSLSNDRFQRTGTPAAGLPEGSMTRRIALGDGRMGTSTVHGSAPFSRSRRAHSRPGMRRLASSPHGNAR